jgi:hypothetical protein
MEIPLAKLGSYFSYPKPNASCNLWFSTLQWRGDFASGLQMIARNDVCPICNSPAFKGTDDVVPSFSCVRCGDFRIDGARWKHGELTSDQLIRLSGWIREQNAAIVTPAITPEIFSGVTARPIPRLAKRAFQALRVFAKQHPRLDTWVVFDSVPPEYELLAVSYSAEQADLDILLELLVTEGLLRRHQGAFSISVRGLLELETASAAGSDSATGFVAMNFDAAMNDAWTNGFEPAIYTAGFSALRISDKDYVGGITDQIMAEIRRARFVVADYTGQKAGVYFEAGFALGLGLSVIPTCRADEVDKLHFDIKHLNTLLWNEPGELADKLARRIRAVVGSGPNIAAHS